MTYFNVHELKRNLVLTHALGNGVSKPHELLVSLSLRRFRVLTEDRKDNFSRTKRHKYEENFLASGIFWRESSFQYQGQARTLIIYLKCRVYSRKKVLCNSIKPEDRETSTHLASVCIDLLRAHFFSNYDAAIGRKSIAWDVWIS